MSISKADDVITLNVDGGHHPIETVIEMINSYLKSYNLEQGIESSTKEKKIKDDYELYL